MGLFACDEDSSDDSSDGSTDASIGRDARPIDASSDPDGGDREGDAGVDSAIVLGELKAFPTAHGYGAYSAGGRGGRVIEVSSYEELRDALYAEGPRIVVFPRSGLFESTASFLTVREPELTILGQTAPAPGITLKGIGLTVSRSEVVLRGFAIRPGSSADESGLDCVRVRTSDEHISNVIFDHLSVSWSDDENMSVGAADGADGSLTVSDVTVQHCLSAEPTGSPYHFLVGRRVDGLSLVRNLYVHGPNRIPENTYGRGERYEFSNNLIFDYNRATTVTTVSHVDVIGNGFKEGAIAPDRLFNVTFSVNSIENPGASLEDAEIFGTDNVQIGDGESTMYNERWLTHARAERALDDSIYTPFPAAELEARLLDDVGQGRGDAVDQRLLDDYRAGTGQRNISDESQVGGFPAIPTNTHPEGHDANGNHVADAFEAEHGITDVDDKPELFTIGELTFDNRAYAGGSYVGAGGHTVNEYQGGTLAGGRLYTWREIYWADLAGDFDPAKWP